MAAKKKAPPKIKITQAQHLDALESIQAHLSSEPSARAALGACMKEISLITKFPVVMIDLEGASPQRPAFGITPESAATLANSIGDRPAEWRLMAATGNELGYRTIALFPLTAKSGTRTGLLVLAHVSEVDLDQTAVRCLQMASAMLGLFCHTNSTERHSSGESTQRMNAVEVNAALAAEAERKLQEQETLKLKQALDAAQKEIDETRKTAVQLALLKEEHVREISREREEWLTLQLLFRSLAEKAAQPTDPAHFCSAVHQLLKRLMPAENFAVVLFEGDQFTFPYLSDQKDSEPAQWVSAHRSFINQVLAEEETVLSVVTVEAKSGERAFNCVAAPVVLSKERRGVAMAWDPSGAYAVREKEIMQFIAWEINGVLQRKNTEEEFRSPWDEATLLPKSRLFPLLMSHHLAHARRNRELVAVMILEIGQLEATRIWLELPGTEPILKQMAERLMQKMREGDVVVRLGDACFLWSLSGFHKTEDVAIVAEKMLDTVAVPMEIQGKQVSLKGSIGISLFPSDSDDPDQLVSYAAAALEQSRESTKNSFTFYASEVNEDSRSKLTMKSELIEALAKQEFALHYQPIVEISTGEVEGIEALVRWRKPLGQTVYPGQFLGFTEEIGLAANLDEWVLSTALRQRNTWEQEGLGSLRLHVNLSSQFFWERAIDRLSAILQSVEIDPDQLEVEINERTIVKDPEKAVIVFNQIRSLGIRIAMDDFGSGGLSVFHLRHYPIQTLKIDPSFVRGINAQAPNAPAIYATMSIAKSLKLRVIAEGVESQSELQFLRTMGCDGYQGNHFSPALPRTLFAELVKKQRTKRPETPAPEPRPAVTKAPAAAANLKIVSPPPVAPNPAPVVKPQVAVSGGTDTYMISCLHCRERLNALQADWCRCLASDPTLVCPKCGKCFCKAPLEFVQGVWEKAPEALWDRRRKYEREHNDVPVNPPAIISPHPHVLVVDDERRILNCAHGLIKGLGYSVVLAKNGEEGLRAAREYKPKVVLSDALMPKMDGREMCRLLKADPETAGIKLVIMTSFTGAGKYKATILKEHHFDDHLTKPIEFERLKATLERFFGPKS